jgi:hypothetical protein
MPRPCSLLLIDQLNSGQLMKTIKAISQFCVAVRVANGLGGFYLYAEILFVTLLLICYITNNL